ncbi:VOC family protein [Bradyrhizobium prioriisuperbiae]|uniref:VOC family protein n=1 Tax=Bradyrhizobium prioriisuperbiae TaxID=2854389 RepID=UPI0028E9D4C0|nr:VOC family protein [Bradyrhizobium prioritasuperba]
MSEQVSAPEPRFTVLTLGVDDVGKSSAFYRALGFTRRLRATGDEVAFFETGGSVLALYSWDKLAREAELEALPRPPAFRGAMLAWNCRSEPEVDATLAFAVAQGAKLLKPARRTDYGGYAGYFSDPDGHPWEVVVAPGIDVGDDRRVHLAE